MNPLTAEDVLRIARLFRLQWEPAQNAHVLLYPEGMVKLNASAGEILKRLDGRRNVEQVAQDCEAAFGVHGLLADVLEFLHGARAQGWVCHV